MPSELRLHPYPPVEERNKTSQPSEVSVCLFHRTRGVHSDSVIYVVAKMRSQRRKQCLRRSKVVREPPAKQSVTHEKDNNDRWVCNVNVKLSAL